MSQVVQPGAVLAGKYQVERLVGEGGMGVVVAARHVDTGQLVALKFMLPAALAFHLAAQRFIREGQVLSVLHGENLARVFDMGMLDNGCPYFAMEYLDGIDLSKVVRQYGALSVADAVEFLLQASTGMAEAHRHGVVHRDLKPANLLLMQRADGSALIKVLDFGLSKILTEDEPDEQDSVTATKTTGTMGTPAYMSPEQARSAKYVDERSDVWSLGAILYYLLSAGLPFPAQATAEAFAKVLYDDPEPLVAAAPWVPPALEQVVLRCLQKNPDQRYQTVSELMNALAPFARDGGHVYRPAPGQSIIIEGPSDLDVASILQQRTAMTFESMEVAVGRSITQEPVLRHPTGRLHNARPHRRTTMIAAIAGMIVGACIIAGAVIFMGRGSSSAATTPQGAIKGAPSTPGAAGGANATTARDAPAAAAAGSALDADRDVRDPDDEDDLDDPDGDEDSADERARKRRHRSRRHKRRPGKDRGGKQHTIVPDDPFGTIH